MANNKPPKLQSCSGCVFYAPHNNYGGHCFRFPPQVLSNYLGERYDPPTVFDNYRPFVAPDDGCGEWSKA